MPETQTNPPAKFSDLKGHEWSVRLDFAGLHRIREGCDVDLGDVERMAQTWADLLYDDQKALKAVWLAIKPTAEAQQATLDSFLEQMDGETLQAALEALGNAVISFTQPRKRGMVEKAIRGVVEGMAKAVAQAELKIEQVVNSTTAEALEALGTLPPSVQELLATSTIAGTSAKP